MEASKSPFVFYYMQTDTADRMLQSFYDNPASYEKWYFENAERFEVSDEFYKEVILGDPSVHAFISSRILKEGEEEKQIDSASVHFYFDVFSSRTLLQYLKNIKKPISKTKEFQDVLSLVEKISNKELRMRGEYDKKNGWFNYDEVMRTRKAKMQQIKDDLNKAGFDYK